MEINNIPEDALEKSLTLRTMSNRSIKPTIFLPNYGEFGSTVHKLIKMVHFHTSPEKIVCCKKGDEALFPSANKFYYDWEDCVEDVHRWGFFTKKRLQGRKNHRYREYQNLIALDFEKIKQAFGQDCNYIHLWKYNHDNYFQDYAHHFRVKLTPIIAQDIKADIIISPRDRKGRPENNFLKWDRLINVFNRNGYSVGCVGSEEQSLKLNSSYVNSWDYEDNSSAVIELLGNCKLYLGLDTGVSHLASMMSAPMIVFSHSNQRHYLTKFMKQSTTNYFLDLGKNVQNVDVITNSVMKFFGEKNRLMESKEKKQQIEEFVANSKFSSYDEYVSLQKFKPLNMTKKEREEGTEWEIRVYKKYKKELIKELKKNHSVDQIKHILVIGARFGSDVLLLREGGYACKITAIDLHDPPLNENVIFGDAHDLSFLKDDVDMIWAYNVFEHLLKPSKVISEICKYSNNCTIALGVPNFEIDKDPYDAQEEFENIDDLKNMLIKYGFKEAFFRSYFIGRRKVPQYWLIYEK